MHFLRSLYSGALCSFVIAWTGCASAEAPRQYTVGQTAHEFEFKGQPPVRYEYLAYLPARVKVHPKAKYPAIIFLHGSGERGTNVWLVARHGPPKIVTDKPDFDFIVISPQCPPGKTWTAESVAALTLEVEGLYPIDKDRVYLTGLSMGGFGTWSTILVHPELYAAVVPICGGGDSNAVTQVSSEKKTVLAKLPIWAFHGAKDPTVKLEASQKMVGAYNQIGNSARLTVHPDAGHDSWTQTYNDPELYKWLLQHDRVSNNTKK
ncbi:MAG: phospholipase/carboxylesterase [Verrucomicrobiales bacterium]|nr:phospholipase/carboxylesterase [Verrucomicrobiales bacterium]